MRVFIVGLFLVLPLVSETTKVLVINSNDKIEKYNESYLAFKEDYEGVFNTIVVSNMKSRDIKEFLYDEYPDVIYTIGSKAYQYANFYIPEKIIFFSSIVNWKRLPSSTNENRFGVSHELHSEMQLTLIKTAFPTIEKIGIVYSKYTEELVKEVEKSGKSLDIKVEKHRIFEGTSNIEEFKSFINKTDAVMIIPEPTLLRKENLLKEILTFLQENKKPILAYHQLFLDYGAVLIVSADNPTTGRQISTMINGFSDEFEDVDKVQYPAGTKIIFNKKEADRIGLDYSQSVLYISNEVVE
jgi:putative ABC transport system substrate-binding protein